MLENIAQPVSLGCPGNQPGTLVGLHVNRLQAKGERMVAKVVQNQKVCEIIGLKIWFGTACNKAQ